MQASLYTVLANWLRYFVVITTMCLVERVEQRARRTAKSFLLATRGFYSTHIAEWSYSGEAGADAIRLVSL